MGVPRYIFIVSSKGEDPVPPARIFPTDLPHLADIPAERSVHDPSGSGTGAFVLVDDPTAVELDIFLDPDADGHYQLIVSVGVAVCNGVVADIEPVQLHPADTAGR